MMTASHAYPLIAASVRDYQFPWLRHDLLAGITLAAYLLPAALGDASLASLPPEAGLYSCLFGGLVFWLFCSSRHTVITVTSAISLLMGSSLGEIAGGARRLAAGPERRRGRLDRVRGLAGEGGCDREPFQL
jgi:MFS superfamily sulfate permease-like transporter